MFLLLVDNCLQSEEYLSGVGIVLYTQVLVKFATSAAGQFTL